MDDGPTELSLREQSILAELEQSLARGELVREPTLRCRWIQGWLTQRWTILAAGVSLAGGGVALLLTVGVTLQAAVAGAAFLLMASGLGLAGVAAGAPVAGWCRRTRMRRLSRRFDVTSTGWRPRWHRHG